MKITLFTAYALLQMAGVLIADDGYKMPPKAIVDIVDAPMTPRISISPDKKHVLLLERPSLPSIKELAQPELRLAGVRINPTVNGRSRAAVYTSITIKNIETGKEKRVSGFPRNAAILQTSWSPDGNHIAVSAIVNEAIHLFLAQTKNGRAKMLFNKALNSIYGSPMFWLGDSKGLIVKSVPDRRGSAPVSATTPPGPIIQENLGIVSPARTYQDLLTSPHDEDLFDYYLTSQVLHVNLKGKVKKLESLA